jgi:hypothetical protein
LRFYLRSSARKMRDTRCVSPMTRGSIGKSIVTYICGLPVIPLTGRHSSYLLSPREVAVVTDKATTSKKPSAESPPSVSEPTVDGPSSQAKPVPKQWSSADIRLLVITFLATTTANIVTVLFVGVAIALAHTWHPERHSAVPYVVLLGVTAITVVPVCLFVGVLRTRDEGDDLFTRWIRRAVILLGFGMVGMALLFTLLWLGLAAGIH